MGRRPGLATRTQISVLDGTVTLSDFLSLFLCIFICIVCILSCAANGVKNDDDNTSDNYSVIVTTVIIKLIYAYEFINTISQSTEMVDAKCCFISILSLALRNKHHSGIVY